MTKTKRVALYVRVSTGEQTTANQTAELEAWAKRAGLEVVAVYEDKGISGAKGRDKRPAFDAMLKAAVRREFDMLAVWSSDRLGRSMPDLIDVLQTIRATGLALYIHTQALDTSTPAGRALFQMLGVFAELERERSLPGSMPGWRGLVSTALGRANPLVGLGSAEPLTPTCGHNSLRAPAF